VARKAFDIDYPRAVLYGIAIVLALAVVYAASTSGAAFGLYNARWDGTSDLRATADSVGAETHIGQNVTVYDRVRANGTAALVLAPRTDYSEGEAARIERFVRSGGTLVVAGDTRTGNRLLASVGASARFNGTVLRDERNHYRSPALPVADNTSNATVTEGVDGLTLNYGTAVRPGNASAAVASSGYAYLDANSNGEPDENETLQRYPVATTEAVGNGTVVAVSDPSVFINTMQERPGNEQFTRNLLASHDRVVFDYSKTGSLPPLQVLLLVVRRTPLLQALLGAVAVAAVVGWERGWFSGLGARATTLQERATRRLRSPTEGAGDAEAEIGPGADADDFAAYLRARHPDWDDDRIRRVVETVADRE